MRVKHVMTVNPVTCDVNDTCTKAARLMRDRVVGAVCVLDRGKLVGLVTDRLLARACIADGITPEATVGEVMIRRVATVSPDDTIFAVLDTMRSSHFARRIPVCLPGRRLVGIVSIADIAAIARDLVDHLLEADLHHARKRTRALTGAKRIAKGIRRPTKAARLKKMVIRTKRLPSRTGVVRNPVPRLRNRAGRNRRLAATPWDANERRRGRPSGRASGARQLGGTITYGGGLHADRVSRSTR